MTVEIMASKDECIATARSPFQKAADGLIPKAASVGGHELHANDAVALARLTMKADAFRNFPILAVSIIITQSQSTFPKHKRQRFTMPEYKTVRPLKPSAPVILYAVCYFGDADDAACLQFGRHQLHARDKPHDQCSRRRGPE